MMFHLTRAVVCVCVWFSMACSSSLPFSPVEAQILQDMCASFGTSLPPGFLNCANVSDVCDRQPPNIICSSTGTAVEQLTLDGAGVLYFSGTLPDSFGDFSTLRVLTIRNETGI